MLNGESFWALDLTEYDRNGDFLCPICKTEFVAVIPKTHIIKHFRHKNGTEHWEPETPEHLKMKQIICQEAKKLGWDADYEIPLFGQEVIADVFLSQGNIQIAVECQCSLLSLDKFYSKDTFYLSHNIFPLWIFGGNYYNNATSYRSHNHNYRSYQIQRIKKLEHDILDDERDLFLFGDDRFFIVDFQYRYHSEVLGWYKHHPTNIESILSSITKGIFLDQIIKATE